MTEAPKPCPFCGGEPKWRGTRSDYARGLFRLQCLEETHLVQSYGPSEAACIAAWNQRAAIPALEAAMQPSEEEVERVASAIANADLDGPDPEDYWHYLARAAIAAMKGEG